MTFFANSGVRIYGRHYFSHLINMNIPKHICGILTLFVLSCTNGETTQIVKVALDESNESATCYTAVLPVDKDVNSFMVLIPGFGESANDVISASDIPENAAEAGISVFIPILQDGVESYSFSAESQRSLKCIIADIQERFNYTAVPYCIGGFSMGGAAAVRYAELEDSYRPTCVFAIDSPLDYQRFRYATERDVNVYRKGLDEGDSIYVKLLEDITLLVGESPYLLSDTTHEAIRSLVNTPIRYYIEPAEQWWLDNRNTDVLGLNILDGTAFINDLRLIGNNNAELIVTHNKGFRKSVNKYHPHSWSIVEVDELIEWVLSNNEN